jgi:hypothetical protein
VTRQIFLASGNDQQRGPRVAAYAGWGGRRQRSSAVRQKRYGNSAVAVISEAVWAQCRWRRHTGSAITIPHPLAQEMQYAGYIGRPRGRCPPVALGIITRSTAAGR